MYFFHPCVLPISLLGFGPLIVLLVRSLLTAILSACCWRGGGHLSPCVVVCGCSRGTWICMSGFWSCFRVSWLVLVVCCTVFLRCLSSRCVHLDLGYLLWCEGGGDGSGLVGLVSWVCGWGSWLYQHFLQSAIGLISARFAVHLLLFSEFVFFVVSGPFDGVLDVLFCEFTVSFFSGVLTLDWHCCVLLSQVPGRVAVSWWLLSLLSGIWVVLFGVFCQFLLSILLSSLLTTVWLLLMWMFSFPVGSLILYSLAVLMVLSRVQFGDQSIAADALVVGFCWCSVGGQLYQLVLEVLRFQLASSVCQSFDDVFCGFSVEDVVFYHDVHRSVLVFIRVTS